MSQPVCVYSTCAEKAVSPGAYCAVHGCARCGGTMDQETAYWKIHLCTQHAAELRRLGGGGPERLAPEAALSTALVEPDNAPKRYPPLGSDELARARVFGPFDGAECPHDERPRNRATVEWPEPLCHECYAKACERPRAVLTFDDGHREMRRNFIAVKTYRDVLEVGDDVIVRWFEFVKEQREGSRLVMQFYKQIPAPVNALGKPIDFGSAKGATFAHRRVSWWRRFLRWLRLQLALRGVSA